MSIDTNSILRVATAGSVDDGKSTLIGRLLYDSDSICDDHLRALRAKDSTGNETLSLAMLTDGLKSEREQQITIDVAYRYFSTQKRHFILADSPGHEQYTRNMVTAASTADVLIVLVDATKGILPQTKRHSFIGSLMGVPHILVVMNKMDLVGFNEDRFEQIKEEYFDFASKLSVKDIRCIPISALQGDQVVSRSENMPWFNGETVFEYLENVYVGSDKNLIDLRFPVQYVVRPDQNFRGYAGQIASGSVRQGDKIIVLPSRQSATVSNILSIDKDIKAQSHQEATAPASVILQLDKEIDITRGDMIVRTGNTPRIANQFEAMMVWMGDTQCDPSKVYILRQTTREVKVTLEEIRYLLDVNTLHRKPPQEITKNEVFSARLSCRSPLCIDDYRLNRSTGAFIILDPDDFFTVAAGMVMERSKADEPAGRKGQNQANLHHEKGLISRAQREERTGHKACTFWLTGLSGSGKSTIAKALESKLFERGHFIYRLDGDNLRSGLNKDLGFSAADRSENIRRVAEVAALLNDSGVSVICSFISPFENDRSVARGIIGKENFLEIYIKASIQTCEMRDPHGLYERARRGEIPEFTGISSPYEEPKEPSLILDTELHSVDELINTVLSQIPIAKFKHLK